MSSVKTAIAVVASTLAISFSHVAHATESSAVRFQLAQAAKSEAAKPEVRAPDVIFVPTPSQVVDEMLKVTNVKSGDVLYDLGSGDGRIVITAAKRFGVRGVGIDIDPQRIAEANENARKEGVAHLVTFKQADLFATDISEATVVTLYLLPRLNVKLRPKLFADLKNGTRIVSHAFDMAEWEPEKHLKVDGRDVYYWTINEKSRARFGPQAAK